VVRESEEIGAIQRQLASVWLGDNPRHAAALQTEGLVPATRSMTALDLARRPHVGLDAVLHSLTTLEMWPYDFPTGSTLERAQVAIRYGAFIEKEQMEAERHRKAAEDRIDPDMDYTTVRGIRIEAQQRLNAARPLTVGQAQKTAGVTPADISALLVHLSRIRSVPVQYGPYGDHHVAISD
jgi:tRNA uridine 5-carboxymethylaminomethyl modification enzyme